MNPESKDWARLAEAVESLRREVALLGGRVSAIESAVGSTAAGAAREATVSAPAEPTSEDISEELILVIGAAVAAYLGKRASVRQIRLLGSAAWAQQGRATIQASHILAAR
jgi:methylmalonyl-CoA carboxyltransferase 12S subunit